VSAAPLHDVALVTASTTDYRAMNMHNNAEEESMQSKIENLFECLADEFSGFPCGGRRLMAVEPVGKERGE
jgi:hypothetical protein